MSSCFRHFEEIRGQPYGMPTDFLTHPKHITARWGGRAVRSLRGRRSAWRDHRHIGGMAQPPKSGGSRQAVGIHPQPTAVFATWRDFHHVGRQSLRMERRGARQPNQNLTNVKYIFRNDEGVASGRSGRARGGSSLREFKGHFP